MLKKILLQTISSGNLSPVAQEIASVGRKHARNLMVSDTIDNYTSLLENVIKFPSEIAFPKAVTEISSRLRGAWQWYLFENFTDVSNLNKASASYGILDKIEEQQHRTQNEDSANNTSRMDEAFSLIAWEEEKLIEMMNARKRLEDEEVRYAIYYFFKFLRTFFSCFLKMVI